VAAGPWIVPPGLGWLGARGDVAGLAGAYIARRYWAVPAALANGALAGWLVGQRRVRAVLAAEVGANIVHIALDLGLVLGLHWGVAGVATASALSEWLKLAFLVAMVARQGIGERGARCGAPRRSGICWRSTATCFCAPCC
jgi:MATE family multidrug resistance protein